jgi:hypothetical protein
MYTIEISCNLVGVDWVVFYFEMMASNKDNKLERQKASYLSNEVVFTNRFF